MDIVIRVAAALLMGAGVCATLLPAVPALPLMWVLAAVYGWYEGFRAITWGYLGFIGALVLLTQVAEHYSRAWGARRFGGSRAGAWGAVIGSVLGLFFMPFGLVLGPFLGAVAGELLAGRTGKEAFRSGLGSVLGVLAGVAANLAVGLTIFLTFLFRLF